jgi:hypothetical protein
MSKQHFRKQHALAAAGKRPRIMGLQGVVSQSAKQIPLLPL